MKKKLIQRENKVIKEETPCTFTKTKTACSICKVTMEYNGLPAPEIPICSQCKKGKRK